MLIVVSERNFLSQLNRLNVYPNFFYTDLLAFQQDFNLDAPSFDEDTQILFILSGCINFKATKLGVVLNVLKSLDTVALTVLSNVEVPAFLVSSYYKYTSLTSGITYIKDKKVTVSTDFWSKFRGQKSVNTSKVLLDPEVVYTKYTSRDTSNDVYLKGIQIFNVSDYFS